MLFPPNSSQFLLIIEIFQFSIDFLQAGLNGVHVHSPTAGSGTINNLPMSPRSLALSSNSGSNAIPNSPRSVSFGMNSDFSNAKLTMKNNGKLQAIPANGETAGELAEKDIKKELIEKVRVRLAKIDSTIMNYDCIAFAIEALSYPFLMQMSTNELKEHYSYSDKPLQALSESNEYLVAATKLAHARYECKRILGRAKFIEKVEKMSRTERMAILPHDRQKLRAVLKISETVIDQEQDGKAKHQQIVKILHGADKWLHLLLKDSAEQFASDVEKAEELMNKVMSILESCKFFYALDERRTVQIKSDEDY